MFRKIVISTLASLCLFISHSAMASDYLLASGDVVRISVFNHQDLNAEVRVSEDGSIKFPLIGLVPVAGKSIRYAESEIARLLKAGGYVLKPQISLLVTQFIGSQVSVLGFVNRPGRYPINSAELRLTDVLAMAGGISSTGGEVAVVKGTRDGLAFQLDIDIPMIFESNSPEQNPLIMAGDSVFVDRAPVFYVYGEVQRPGAFPLMRHMTVMQAISTGGGITLRGSSKDIVINRPTASGANQEIKVELTDRVSSGDVIFVQESFF
ncbi:polysaccharide export protein EpsE [Neiella marina]|uniref:Polysaccharide export protein EpsE n=1 Tax=Neiella holothuriorum TaxID=2870530 RepID=A0ABS7EE40_9GAMM|nr:polysaccharide export protein EpsE [Neiella holothuriorum]MBW8190585.1 polysaccharide export protein EpsE [Neiella holothuriorum]